MYHGSHIPAPLIARCVLCPRGRKGEAFQDTTTHDSRGVARGKYASARHSPHVYMPCIAFPHSRFSVSSVFRSICFFFLFLIPRILRRGNCCGHVTRWVPSYATRKSRDVRYTHTTRTPRPSIPSVPLEPTYPPPPSPPTTLSLGFAPPKGLLVRSMSTSTRIVQ